MKLVSVLMPVYRPNLKFLREAVESILGQEYRELELVIVEDPATGIGRAVVGGFDDPRIRYTLNPKRTSLTEQLNLGLSLCGGKYIARMDADDISYPGRMGAQAAFLDDNPGISVVGSDLEVMDEQGVRIGIRKYPERHEDIIRSMRRYNPLPHPAVMFRKKDVEASGGYKAEAPIEDYDLWARMAAAGKKFHNIQEPLVRYRVHSKSGKSEFLKRQLKATIELKEKYFKGRDGWGIRENSRLNMERLMVHMPARFVMRLFLFATIKR